MLLVLLHYFIGIYPQFKIQNLMIESQGQDIRLYFLHLEAVKLPSDSNTYLSLTPNKSEEFTVSGICSVRTLESLQLNAVGF